MILPLVPLRDVVIFPGVVTPLFVGRDKSINALLVAKKNSELNKTNKRLHNNINFFIVYFSE